MKPCSDHKDTNTVFGSLRTVLALAVRQLSTEFMFDVDVGLGIALQVDLHCDRVDDVEGQEEGGGYKSHTTEEQEEYALANCSESHPYLKRKLISKELSATVRLTIEMFS